MEFDIVCPVRGKGKMSTIYLNLFPAVSVWWEKPHPKDKKNGGLRTTQEID